MNPKRPFLSLAVSLIVSSMAFAQEEDLLRRFQAKNQEGRGAIQAQVAKAVEDAKAIQASDSERAMEILRQTRGQLLASPSFKQNQELIDPVQDLIYAISRARSERGSNELLRTASQYRLYLERVHTEFQKMAENPPNSLHLAHEPLNRPAWFAYTNGVQDWGYLHNIPEHRVVGTLNGAYQRLGPEKITGIQVEQGFYFYNPRQRRYVFLAHPQAAFFAPAIKPGFWVSPSIEARKEPVHGESLASLALTYGQIAAKGFDQAPDYTKATAEATNIFRTAILDAQINTYLPNLLDEERREMHAKVLRAIELDAPAVVDPNAPESAEQSAINIDRLSRILAEEVAKRKRKK